MNSSSSINSLDSSQKLAVDATSLNELKTAAKQNTPEAIKETAKQFEALFVGMMLKSMRKATPQDGPFDNEQSKMFTSMLDEQISQKVAAKGLGLADVLAKQMMNNAALQYSAKQPKADAPASSGSSSVSSATVSSVSQHAKSLKAASPDLSNSQAQVLAFQQKLGCCAQDASAATGIPAKFMLGQAALESGWGKHELVAANGQPSYNVFGIKAGSSWTGKTVNAVTTEYINGVPTQKVEKFRAYDNYQQAFNDYASLLQGNQRYKNVLANAKDAQGFAQGLQKAGYATDPNYANKVMSVIKGSLST